MLWGASWYQRPIKGFGGRADLPKVESGRRPGRRLLLIAAVVALSVAALTRSAGAVTNALTTNPGNDFKTTALYAPTGLTATPSGHNVALTWTAGQNGSGYSVQGVSNGTSNNCSAAVYSAVGTSATTSYTDTGRFTPQGTYFCYQVLTSYGSNWTSVQSNPTAVAQIGVVITSVVIANGGVAGKIDPGDTVAVTFNQPINTATGPASTQNVCWTNTATIMIGVTASSGACATTETLSLLKLTAGTSSANGRYNATWAWSNGNKTLTMTVGSTKQAGGVSNTSGTWTANPTTVAASLQSATGAFHTCDTNTGGGSCLPAATGSF